MRNVRAWIGLAMVTVVVCGMGLSAFAEPKPSDRHPSDYYLSEFWLGELGAIVGGFINGFICDNIEECRWKSPDFSLSYLLSCQVGLQEYCERWQKGWSSFLSLVPGRALGASIGVIYAGSRNGIEGNIWGTLAMTGSWLALTTFTGLVEIPVLDAVGNAARMPLVPAILATIGYNLGARMKSDKSKPAALDWYLPLVALRF